MKKLIATLLSTLMIFGLVACGDTGETGGDADYVMPAADTVAVGAVLIARDDVAADDIYALVSTIFDNTAAIADLHAKGLELDLNFAASVDGVPYHAGAAKYFAEKGLNVAAVADNPAGNWTKSLSLTTGSDTGTYYGFGGVLASYVSSNTDLDISVKASTGSQANIENLVAGSDQIAFTQSDVLSYAFNGQRLFDEALKGYSVVAALYMEQVQIVTLDENIVSVADLAGKTVSVGAVGSGAYFNAVDVLGAYGLTEDDLNPVYQNFGDSAESLKDGKIDAAFIVAGAPTTAIVDLAQSYNVHLVNVDGSYADALLAASPFYSVANIAEGTY